MTEIPIGEGKLYLATVLDLCSRRLLACPTSAHPKSDLACDAITIAAASRGGACHHRGRDHSHRPGSTYTASRFTALCRNRLGVRQSI
ncbi:DDE-type integrase/transposase/recombinase [Mycobacterium antarcticum]|uniref:DDE-type integrase/transposase/recombinase n=1 Tax=unclassified Mycolicibacterium TaxID=2636767 RepID=UPI0024E0AFAE|nr:MULTISPECIES: DDE-type integrase/transposase/recombinase [unclassified Mycolicibacterium]